MLFALLFDLINRYQSFLHPLVCIDDEIIFVARESADLLRDQNKSLAPRIEKFYFMRVVTYSI